MELSELLQVKKQEILRIAKEHGVIRIWIFGSVVRGEATGKSDIDFLIQLQEGRSLLDLIGFKQDLEELFGQKVDVVSEGGVSPYLKDRIFREAVPL